MIHIKFLFLKVSFLHSFVLAIVALMKYFSYIENKCTNSDRICSRGYQITIYFIHHNINDPKFILRLYYLNAIRAEAFVVHLHRYSAMILIVSAASDGVRVIKGLLKLRTLDD